MSAGEGSGGPRARCREAAGKQLGVHAIPSLAGVGRDEAPPWAGGVPVAAEVLEALLVGQPRSRALACFRCRSEVK